MWRRCRLRRNEGAGDEGHAAGTLQRSSSCRRPDVAVSAGQTGCAGSASLASEEKAVHKGETRPVDPKDADDVLTHKLGGEIQLAAGRDAADAAILAASRRRTRRAFVSFGAAAAAAYGFRRYLKDAPFDDMIPGLLHKAYAWNADVSRALFREHALAPTYPRSKAETLRVNGVFWAQDAVEA